MKLLLYSINYAPELTGVGKYSTEMAEWLMERGHDVRVLTALPYYPEWKVQPGFQADATAPCPHSSRPCLPVFRSWIWAPRRPTGARRILHLLSFAAASFQMLRRELKRKPDVVFVVLPTLFIAPQAVWLARRFGVKTWAHVHDFEIDAALNLNVLKLHRGAGWLHALERKIFQSFDRVSTISSGMFDRLSFKRQNAENAMIFPNWVDIAQFSPPPMPNGVRAELGLADDDLLLLYAGNMGEKQGLEIVIEAARRLNGQRRIQFLLVGDGSARARLHAEAGAMANVRWWPLQPAARLSELLFAADIHLLPQRMGAADLVMPSKLGPALASGRLVLGTAEPDTELGRVLDTVGLRVPPEDQAAFVDAIEQAVAQPAWRQERGQLGRAYAQRHLDKAAVLAGFERQCIRLAGAEQASTQVPRPPSV